MALASRAAATSAAAAAAAVACVLLALAASAAGAGSPSHSPAPAPAVDCVTQAATLSDCIDYVSPSGTRRPSAACCGEVKTAVASPVIVGCLCSLAGSSKNLGIPIDPKRVLALPGACGVSNAGFSKCNISALSPTGAAPAPSTGVPSSGGATASPPHAAAASSPPMTATALVAAVAAPLLAYCYFF